MAAEMAKFIARQNAFLSSHCSIVAAVHNIMVSDNIGIMWCFEPFAEIPLLDTLSQYCTYPYSRGSSEGLPQCAACSHWVDAALCLAEQPCCWVVQCGAHNMPGAWACHTEQQRRRCAETDRILMRQLSAQVIPTSKIISLLQQNFMTIVASQKSFSAVKCLGQFTPCRVLACALLSRALDTCSLGLPLLREWHRTNPQWPAASDNSTETRQE